jgi:hypothetical protein
MPQIYQGILWVEFLSSESFQRVPKDGEMLRIRAPTIDSTREGGLGLHELQELLKASDRVDDESQSPEVNIMQGVIDSGNPKEGVSRPKMLDFRVERACTYLILRYELHGLF